MKLAVQQTLVPGDSLLEKFQRAADYGFDGVELAGVRSRGSMAEFQHEVERALAQVDLQVASLCTGGNDDFVHPDAREREKRLRGLVEILELADALGAAGAVALPIRTPQRLPDFSPVIDERTLTTKLATSVLERVLSQTPDGKAAIFLEPLNRYEAHYLKTLADGAALCAAVSNPRVQVMGDLFHMHIEEADPVAALTAHAAHLGHMHLADSNRLPPGYGHLDFVSIFRALREVDYRGWLAFECTPGDARETLPKAVEFVRRCWDAADPAQA